MMQPMILSEDEWRRRLSPAQYHVLREAATEPAFSGCHADTRVAGLYRCVACRIDLFDAADKFDPGIGWPCFARPIGPDRVTEHGDAGQYPRRVEVRCARCDGHLGHVFADGPPPTGRRYRLNSLALDFRGCAVASTAAALG